ncbi:hybrid sensor histidine kinase/response regulator [Halapricum desulfuricans]|uniref:hybrid sensor histidine kinase/response regulator n=1 Tax=Halapricum desulfuricans TaxID=2841257 RepID=UPI001E421FF7|nr:PAS domain S-box protein [Halapricum desulfuricans]
MSDSGERRDAHFRDAQAIANLGSWERDLTDDRVYWSAELKRLLDVPRDTPLTDERFLERVHPGDRAVVEENWSTLGEDGGFDIEHRLVTDDSDTRWVRQRATVQRDEDGTPGTAVGVVQDITERKQYERELEEHRRRFRTLFEQFPQPTVEIEYLSDEPIVRQVNSAFEETFGYSAEEIVGESLDSYIVPQDRQQRAREINDRVQSTGRLVSEEVTRRTNSGERHFILQNAVYNGGSKALGVYTDITDRREREIQLQKAQNVANLGYWSMDFRSGEVYWSEQICDIWGFADGTWSIDEDTYMEYVHPDDRDAVAKQWQAAKEGEPYDIEHRIVTDGGETKWVRANADFEFDNAGNPVSAIGIVQEITERKQRESRLETQAEAMEVSMEGIALLDETGEFIYMNQAHADVFGYDPEDLLGRTWRCLYDEAEIARFENTVFPEIEDAGKWRGEAVGQTRHGTRVHHELTLSRLDDGKLICTNKDITERKQREWDLRRFRRAIEASAHSIYITDCNGTIEYVNPAFERTTGYSAEEAVGRTPAILRSEANDEELYEEMWDTILKGDTWHGELINTTKQGDQYVVNKTIAPVTDDSDETTHFVSVNKDVTEMREQQDELYRLRQAIDKAHIPLTMTDPAKDDNPMVYINEAFTDLTGYSEAELLGENCRLLQGPDSDPETVADLRAAIDNEEQTTVELRNYRKDGTMFWSQITVTPVYDTDGDLIRWLGTQRDITERKEREQHLQVLERVLRHNIRNDIHVIRGFAEAIQDATSGTIATHAESIRTKSDQLVDTANKQRMITEVLLERPVQDTFEINDLLQHVTQSVAEDYPDATIHVHCPEDITVVASSRIGQAVEELLVNAIQHNDTASPVVKTTVSRDDEHVSLDIADNGPAIPDMEQQVGTRGEKVDPLYHGSGLGLWLVYWIVTRSDGTVVFEENDPSGNRVKIELPRSR